MPRIRGLESDDRSTVTATAPWRWSGSRLALSLACSGALLLSGLLGSAAAGDKEIRFDLERSAKAEADNCLAGAGGRVKIHPQPGAEHMRVEVSGLPANTSFNLFVIQLPNTPFGMSWYQGDIETNHEGKGHGKFVGRFNNETFVVAPGSGPAPVLHAADASSNPTTAPVHMFHLGLWFDSPADALAAGCSGGTTPFNGDHTAGIQALSTRNFANDQGPLRQVP